MKVLIENCSILVPDAVMGYVPNINICIEGNMIESISNRKPRATFDRILSGHNRLAIPGLINAHTHSPENFMRGTTERLPLEPWLVYLFGMCGEYSPRDHYLNVMLGAIEMLHSGVTSVVDHLWMSPIPSVAALDSAMMAYRDSGMRAVVAPLLRDAQFDVDFGIETGHSLEDTFFAKIGRNLPSFQQVLEIAETTIKRWNGAENGRLGVFVGPAGLQWCSDKLLSQSKDLAQRYNTGFHTHLLETRVQDWICRRRFGESSVKWMFEHGLLDENVSLAHSVHVTEEEIKYIAKSGASVIHNITANLRLGSGIAPIRSMLDEGIPVALGTDGACSNDNQVLFETLRLAALIHNLMGADPEEWISSREAWEMVTKAGAYVLRKKGSLGELEEGQLADIVLLDTSSPHLVPLNDAYRNLVFCETGSSIRTVIVNGDVIMHDGQIEAFDENAIIDEAAEKVAARLYRQGKMPEEVQSAIDLFSSFRQDVLRNLNA